MPINQDIYIKSKSKNEGSSNLWLASFHSRCPIVDEADVPARELESYGLKVGLQAFNWLAAYWARVLALSQKHGTAEGFTV